MFKKLIFIALGATIIAVRKSTTIWSKKGTRLHRGNAVGEEVTGHGHSSSEVENTLAPSEADDSQQKDTIEPAPIVQAEVVGEADDLTAIVGIGPTYAARLQAAGITTFRALVGHSAEELREIVGARGQSANTAAWIDEAKALL